MNQKEEILHHIGRFYVERNLNPIRNLLHSNIVFSTVINPQYKAITNNWEEKDIYGTKNFIRYYTEKFSNGKSEDLVLDYQISKNSFNGYYFIVLKTNCKAIIASVLFHNGKIKLIHLHPSKTIKNAFYHSGTVFMRAHEQEMNKRLHRFAARLDMKNILHCLSKGANINSRDEHGETALTIISRTSKLDFVKFNIQEYHIKNENVKLNTEQKQKYFAMKKRLADGGYVFEMDLGERWKESLVEMDKSYKTLNEYIKKIANPLPSERIDMMKKLLERSAWINDMSLAVKKSARNALFYAVQKTELETVEFLLNNGASINEEYSGLEKNIIDIAKDNLQIMEGNFKKLETEKLILIEGSDKRMLEKEISDLKQIIILLGKFEIEKQ